MKKLVLIATMAAQAAIVGQEQTYEPNWFNLIYSCLEGASHMADAKKNPHDALFRAATDGLAPAAIYYAFTGNIKYAIQIKAEISASYALCSAMAYGFRKEAEKKSIAIALEAFEACKDKNELSNEKKHDLTWAGCLLENGLTASKARLAQVHAQDKATKTNLDDAIFILDRWFIRSEEL